MQDVCRFCRLDVPLPTEDGTLNCRVCGNTWLPTFTGEEASKARDSRSSSGDKLAETINETASARAGESREYYRYLNERLQELGLLMNRKDSLNTNELEEHGKWKDGKVVFGGPANTDYRLASGSPTTVTREVGAEASGPALCCQTYSPRE